MNVLIETKNLCKSYGTGEGMTVALKNVNLDIREGELLAILGSSGSGKSTLLNILGGMDKADSGSVLYKGTDICTYNDRKLTDYRKDCVGFVFQSFNLIAELTAWENVALTAAGSQGAAHAESKGEKTKGSRKASSGDANTQRALQTVGLLHKRDKYPSQLSGGEQQRISIARALAKETAFLLCDEPTGALDYETGKQILVQLWDLARIHGKTIVVVTHTQEITRMCDRVIRMRSGEVVSIEENSAPVHAREIEW